MISAMNVALQRIHNTIPEEILVAAFKAHDYDVSLDELIKQKVILARVLDSASVRGGPILKFLLRAEWCHTASAPSPYLLGLSEAYSYFHIPPEARDHRDIACAISVRFPYSLTTSNAGGLYSDTVAKGNTLGGLACATLSSVTGAGTIAMPRANVLPGNVIKLTPPQFNYIPWQVTVRLKYDEEFTTLEVSSIETFSKLVEYAVKAYIYSHMLVEVESNAVYRGLELGVFRDQISSFAEANERFDETLILFGGSVQMDVDRLHLIFSRMRR